MDTLVFAQFGMESCGQQPALADKHGVAVALGQHLDLGADALDAWRANVDLLQRTASSLLGPSRIAESIWRP